MNSKLWICEKPKQAMLVASRIGIENKHNGYIETKDGLVTWCVGHMVGFKSPSDYSAKWKDWTLESLPIVPESFDLTPLKGKEKQLKIVGKLLKSSDHVVIATDGDREGELLGREILDYYSWSGKIDRMWNTNLDNESIDKALKTIKSGDQFKGLYLAASARAEADYINGMSLTRAATKAFSTGSDVYSVGRVQTSVLGMIKRREDEHNGFKTKAYFEIVSFHNKDGKDFKLRFSPKPENRLFDESRANELLTGIKDQRVNLSVEQKRKKTQPPQLFNLLSLQQAANKAFKWSASETKTIAQELYDDSLLSYPRTDCKYLPNEQERDVSPILNHLKEISEFSEHIETIGSGIVYRKTVFNTDKTTAHHAIVPTKKKADINSLSAKQKSLYLLVCKRYVASFMPAYEYDSTIVKYFINECEFKGIGNTPVTQGWKLLYKSSSAESDDSDNEQENQVFPNLADGEEVTLDNVFVQELKTKPPAKFTQSSILSAMEDISSLIVDEDLKAKFKKRLKDKENSGIGTPATRDTYLDILVKRSYVTLEKNKISMTKTGHSLIESLPERVSDPIETAVMESILDDISQGQHEKSLFVSEIINETTKSIGIISNTTTKFESDKPKHPCPKCEHDMVRRKGKFGFFWSCSNYPACDNTMKDKAGKPVKQEAVKISDVPCPDCGKPMALRKTNKKGAKSFWGCTGYPECKTSLPDNNGIPGSKVVAADKGEQCPTCNKGNLVKRSIKKGNNKGKEFWGCSVYECKHFDLIES